MAQVANGLWSVSLVAAGFFMEPYIPLGDLRWLLIAVLLLIPNAWIYWPRIGDWHSPNKFDMPIRTAILHILSTEAHSYQHPRLAEEVAFGEIHDLMCAGKLSVVGTDSDLKPPMRIKPKECKRLSPSRVAVPRNKTTPDGVMYSLIDSRDSDSYGIRHYHALRVRSQQIYKYWPKVNGAAK